MLGRCASTPSDELPAELVGLAVLDGVALRRRGCAPTRLAGDLALVEDLQRLDGAPCGVLSSAILLGEDDAVDVHVDSGDLDADLARQRVGDSGLHLVGDLAAACEP